jgi:dihydrofolate reductase
VTTAHVFIGTSLDGFIARLDGDLGWLIRFDEMGEDYGYDSFFSSIDALILGRLSYEAVLRAGPWRYGKPALVASSTMSDADIRPDLAGKVSVTRADPAGMLEQAAAHGWHRVYVDGGKLIQSFLRAGLISDMIITRVPVLIGGGLPLFGPLDRDLEFRHVETRTFPSGMVQSHYAVA